MARKPALTTEQQKEAARLYRGGMGSDLLAKRYGCCTVSILRALKIRGVRIRTGNHAGNRAKDPTPEEIAERAAAIREKNMRELQARSPKPRRDLSIRELAQRALKRRGHSDGYMITVDK